MNYEILDNITDYIEFLREAGYSIVLSCFNPVLEEYLPVLLKYEPHLPAVCSYLKANANVNNNCFSNKEKLKTSTIPKPYYSCCWAGIEEYIIPIADLNNRICLVHISGYCGKMPQSEYLSKKLEMKLGAQFKKVYSQLSSDVPDMKKAMTVTTPLKYMFYELYQECIASSVRTDGTADIYPAVLRYINDHYAESINIANIAEALNYSTSYIRYIFSKKSTKTIGKYINSVRLNHAANLLKFTERTITEIAFESGFHNSNYFSTAFKKYYGLSPCQYRIKFQKNV